MREHGRANICSRFAVQHLRLCEHEGNGDALRHRVDKVRECILREGEAASLEACCISYEAMEVCAKGSQRLDGQRTKTHHAMLSQDIAIRRLLSTLGRPLVKVVEDASILRLPCCAGRHAIKTAWLFGGAPLLGLTCLGRFVLEDTGLLRSPG